MKVSVISSSQNLLELENVDELYAPTTDGTVGILPGHMSLISTLDIGELKIKSDGRETSIILNGGLIQVKNDEILILADEASLSEKLVKEEIKTAIALAEKQISGELPPSELIQLERKLRYERFKMNKAADAM